MGGDHGPSVVVPACVNALKKYSNLKLILVGKQKVIEEHLGKGDALLQNGRLEIQDASQVVGMDESPAHALRSKKNSSMRIAINLVKEGNAQACVSAGNTGALMATARFVFKMLPGIDRPAILFPLPTKTGVVYVLDLGANVECHADHLFQFAVMGSVLVKAVHGIARPKVGLLNVGAEAIKGTEPVKRAAELLNAVKEINYIGFVEGNDLFKDTADVIVCDGFVGNVALKASEGVVKMIASVAKEEFKRNWFTKIAALISLPVMSTLKKRFDPNRHNGASLLGLQGVAIKSHGGANTAAFTKAIKVAMLEAEKRVPDKIREEVMLRLGESSLL